MSTRRTLARTMVLLILLAGCSTTTGGAGDDTADVDTDPTAEAPATTPDAPTAAETDSTDEGDDAADPTGEPIRVGVILSITGDASSLGVPEADTVEMYAEELGQVGDRPIEWIIRDDGSDQTTAVTLARQMMNDDDVSVLICCTTSPISLAVIDSVQEAGVPMIALGAAATIANPVEDREWIFKTAVPDSIITDVIVEHMLANDAAPAATFVFDDGYGESGRDQFVLSAEEAGLEIAGDQTFPRDATDVTAQAGQLQASNPGSYLIWATPPGAVIAQRDLRNLGIQEPIYQSHGAANLDFIELGGQDVEGTFLGVPKLLIADDLPDDDPQKEVIISYRDRFEAEYGEGSINVFGSETLDAMYIIHEALGRAVESDTGDLAEFRSLVRDEIEATEEQVGITGVYTYSPEDHEGLDERCCTIVTVQDGDWVGTE